MSISSLSGIPDEDAWFHDNLTREEAELLLTEFGEERAFLVRDSSSSFGDFAISVFSEGEVHHIQVKRHGEDAFFSVEGRESVHGLDELIRSLQQPQSDDGDYSDVILQKPLIKCLPPPNARRHGRTNLLHRATKEGSIVIVAELVSCKNRNIDAKNEEGQTAAHLAAMNGLKDILVLLIKAGTNVNAKDSSSLTPLHYACRFNHPHIVETLMREGGANPQIRRNDNGWVPMHEAAAVGNLECIMVLFQYNTPLRPRTKDEETPLHLALRENHEKVIKFYDSVPVLESIFNRDEWFHHRLGRHDALEILRAYRSYCEIDPLASYFLVRRHSVKENAYVLTILREEKVYHFEIKREENYLFIDDGPYLDSLEHLIQHYSRWSDGLPCRLQVAVSMKQAIAVSEQNSDQNLNLSSSSLDIPPPLPRRIPTGTSPSRLGDVENNNRLTESPPFSKENIPVELLEIGKLLGEGEYGEVYVGKLKMNRNSAPVDVAIKTLKSEGEMNDWKKNEFLTEARTMLDLEHPNIVKIIGICWSPKTYMVQELCELGSLEEYLQDGQDEIVPSRDFRKWAHQIAKGMVYLQAKRFIHRDLAVRNILLKNASSVKISDFGLSRALGLDSDYYTASHGGRWPIKWYAPESCTHGTFSHATDVWSYGVVLWEIYSFGATPYGDLPGKDVIEKVEKGYRLEKPLYASDQVYTVMLKCWSANPDLRPTFPFLENFFADDDPSRVAGSSTSQRAPPIPTIPPPPLPKSSEPRRAARQPNEESISFEVSLMSFD